MTELNQAIVLLTGATGGFGQEFIRQLLLKNSRLILTDIDLQKLTNVANQLKNEINQGEIIACFPCDLSTPDGCDLLFEKVSNLNLSIDILINNAGIFIYGKTEEIPREEWEKLMQINLLSPMRLTALFLPQMIKQKRGHIVNISSLAGLIGIQRLAHYVSSKFGLRGFTESLIKEVKAHNIKVTGVYPFFSRTPLLQSKAYGSLAENYAGFSEQFATNPNQIIAQVIQAIIKNKTQVFPDFMAKFSSQTQRYFPQLVNLLSSQLLDKLLKKKLR